MQHQEWQQIVLSSRNRAAKHSRRRRLRRGNLTYGSVRGAARKGGPYRDPAFSTLLSLSQLPRERLDDLQDVGPGGHPRMSRADPSLLNPVMFAERAALMSAHCAAHSTATAFAGG